MAQAMTEDGGRVPMSPGLQATLLRAREYAASQSEAEVLLEHLLLALSEDADAANVLEACRIDLSRLRHDVAGYIGSLDDRVPAGTPGTPAISAALTQVLKYATLAAQQGRRASIDGAIVLAALVGDGRSMAAGFLKAQGLTFEAAIRALREVAARPVGGPARSPQKPMEPPPPVAPSASPPISAGSTRTENILARARERVESRSPRTEPLSRSQRADDAIDASPIASAHATGEAATAHSGVAPLPAPALSQLPGSSPTAVAAVASSPEFHGSRSKPAPPPPASGGANSDQQPHRTDSLVDRLPADVSGALQQREAQSPAPVSPPPPLPPQLPKSEPSQPSAAAPGLPAAQATHPQPERASAAGWWARSSQPEASQPRVSAPSDAERTPWPEASRAAWPAQPRPSPHLSAPNTRVAGEATVGPPTIDPAMVSHSIPASFRRGRPYFVEVRVERPPLVPAGAPQRSVGGRPELTAARAIAVRLRPLDGRFNVDASSPETLWEQSGSMSADRLSGEAAVWRFSITPLVSGRGILQLSVSARTIGADGVVAETLLPDQAYEVHVSPAFGSLAVRAGVLLLVAAGSMLALKLAEALLHMDTSLLVRRLLGL